MAGRVGTSQNPAPDQVIDPIKWERRRKAEARKQSRIDEANSDEFAGHVQDYAHENGLNAQQVLDTERAARARGNTGNAGLNRYVKEAREFTKTQNAPAPVKAGEASGNVASWPRPPASVRGAAGSAGGFVLGLFLYGFVLNGLRYGTAGLKAFAQAKFFNKVTTGPWTPATSTSSSTAPGTVGEGPGQLPFYLVPPTPTATSGTGS